MKQMLDLEEVKNYILDMKPIKKREKHLEELPKEALVQLVKSLQNENKFNN